MGTRGIYGFRKNGEDKLSYNHYDSYPDGLGEQMAVFCAAYTIDELNKLCDAIVMVSNDSMPTAQQQKDYADVSNTSVSTGTVEDWYCLLRELQGDLNGLYKKYKAGITPIMIDNREFIKDSLFCEYGYIINLDTNVLEFWKGFQHEPDPENRYGQECEDGYYPCKLVAEFPLDDGFAHVVDEMNRIEEE